MTKRFAVSLWLANIPVLLVIGFLVGFSQVTNDNCNTLESKLFNLGRYVRGWSDIGPPVTKVCNISEYKIYISGPIETKTDSTEVNHGSHLMVQSGTHLIGIDKYSVSAIRNGTSYSSFSAHDSNKDGHLDWIEYIFENRDGETGVAQDFGRTGQLDYRTYNNRKEPASEVWVEGEWRALFHKEGVKHGFVKIGGKLVSIGPIMKNGISLGFKIKDTY